MKVRFYPFKISYIFGHLIGVQNFIGSRKIFIFFSIFLKNDYFLPRPIREV
jgi:hypothetical protein